MRRLLLVAAAAILCAGSCDEGTGGGQGGSGAAGGSGGVDPCALVDPGQLDPAPDRTSPGVFTCPGCPVTDLDSTSLELGVQTSHPFAGTVTGTDCGGYFFVKSEDGGELGGTIQTAEGGAFAVTVPLFCGEQIVKLAWAGESGDLVVVVEVSTDDCTAPELRATLSWDELGDDWELHLVRPGGHINDQEGASDCTWTTCIDESPDWGPEGPAGNPSKDVDSTGAFGPENILLSEMEVGIYTVLVEHWGDGDPLSSGQLVMNVQGDTTTALISRLAPRHVRTVATVDGSTGQVTLLDQDFDCTSQWDEGCLAPLP